ncbi:response regulator [Syntrophorhabdus aromaticivorans]|jgi:DNA-binding response OmpR family regulator|uniref:Response regulator n=1 Tax=Syntrophorhabdus aromaticivorans TaxID=328301 RepID=A0A351U0Y2_9BACT|nr:response regulator [Syntrophorhabdus aromaticivorans]NLW36067.1 response regulator [Syntrophorhabdus aromaticivorans]HBA53613.1 response regulator [Syntrophorhabdus aromaticivorans]
MKTMRLLVVDDEENIRFLFKEELEEEGYEVDLASSGLEALSKIKDSPYDLVVLDIKMPGMSGIQTLSEIKNINKALPVVLCSAYGEFKQDFSSWVSDGYVVKSADTGELKQTIRSILGGKQQTGA